MFFGFLKSIDINYKPLLINKYKCTLLSFDKKMISSSELCFLINEIPNVFPRFLSLSR